MVTKVLENRTVEIRVDDIIQLDCGSYKVLLPSDWDKAQFRVPDPVFGEDRGIAVNLEITGRTFQYRGGTYWVRLHITWPGDGEPDKQSGGWLRVDPWSCPRVE